MKKRCKLISMLLAVVMLAGIVAAAPLQAGAEETPYHAMGYCGANSDKKNVEYYLFDDGSIALFGDGRMEDYSNPGVGSPAAPWYLNNPMEALTGSKVAIEDGITNVGNYAFYVPSGMYTLFLQTYNLDLPNSLTTIGAHAFENQNKIQKLAIPKNVTSIGTDAFKGCSAVQNVDLYCDPKTLNWTENYFSSNVICHVLPEYANQLETIKTRFGTKMTFEANLHADQGLVDDDVVRNIKAYFGTESSKIFGGAAPFVIVGTFSGEKKSVTHGNNGFVSCVQVGNKYYALSSNQSGYLNETNLATGGYVQSLSATPHSDLRLTLTREYIGTNTVKIVYHLENTSENTYSGVKLGSSGDIKIGADDTAAIEPLGEGDHQVGFYMKSSKDFDKVEGGNTEETNDDKYATLGFISENVKISETGEDTSASPTYFYGKADANVTSSATGVYRLRMMPQRIFEQGTDAQTAGTLSAGTDSGMSYFWDNIELGPNEYKTYAVLFSVYGADDTKKGSEMVEEQTATYHTVTWKNADETVLVKQVVKDGETPVYPLETPVLAETKSEYFTFDKWTPEITACNADVTYKATYEVHDKAFFKGHRLSLDGDIGVYFYVDPNVIDTTEYGELTNNSIVIKFSWYDKNSEQTAVVSTDAVEPPSGDNLFPYYYRARCNVAAAEMVYDIHAVAYINGKRYTKEENHYSVRQYGDVVLDANSEFSTAYKKENTVEKYNQLVTLMKTMLDYGAKAQVLFNRRKNTDGTSIPLANEGIDYNMEAHNAISGDIPDMTADLDSGLEYKGSTLELNTTTNLRHYYQVVDEDKFKNLSNCGSFKKNGTLYYLEKESIPAAELDVKQSFTVGSRTYEYSALDLARKLQTNGKTDAHKNLGTALYWFNEAANAFF